jgi:hypothetical protein
MKTDFILEPELEFGVGRHVDIRFGLMNYGPVDYASTLAPKEINLGVVGTNESVEGVCRWLERCRKEVPAKDSRQPNLFPKFPGFCPDVAFQSTLVLDGRLQRFVNQRALRELASRKDLNEVVSESVGIFLNELYYLADNTNADVLLCAVPQILIDATQQLVDEMGDAEAEGDSRPDFHNLLKAKAMAFNKPVQLIIPSTYDETKRRRRRKYPGLMRTLQDEATRAWNLHTALYYKARGVPWRLVRDSSDYTTCYIGISFYNTLDRSTLLTSVAQVFNERGEGVVVRGGPAKLSKRDRQVHLEGEDAEALMCHALNLYRTEHKNYPARVVIHKSSTFSDDEAEGFFSAIEAQGIGMVDMMSLSHSDTRLFRVGSYPPLRGVFWSLDGQKHILYTRGSVDFFSTYPGLYVPSPLFFACHDTEQTPRFLAQEILALTKMNWNNTQFDGGDPITIRAARQVGSILKYIGPAEPVASGYRFYM